MPRPKLHSAIPTRHKKRDPNRKPITKPAVSLKGLTEEQKREHIKALSKEYTNRRNEEEKALEYLKEPPILLNRDGEPYDDFIKRVREKNKRRLDEILNDPEAMWRIFADRDDIRTIEVAMLREKAKQNKSYITDKEVDEVMNEIYGGIKRKKKYEDEEDEEYTNPYEIKQNEE